MAVLVLLMCLFLICKINHLQWLNLTVQVLCRFRFESSVLRAPKQALQGLKASKMYAHRTQLATS